MTKTARIDSDKEVLAMLEEANGLVTVGALLERLSKKGIQNESDIKASIWRLIDEKKIEMTSHRELRSTPGRQAHP